MGLFTYDEEGRNYRADISGIEFICEEVKPEFEKAAPALARVYQEKLPQIAAFMLDDIKAVFGDISADELADALGVPQIDLNREMITYLEHTLDDCHIIDVEYGGLLDEFYEVSIDG